MKKWLARIRGAVGMGVTWAAGWWFVGMVIELITEFVPGWNGAIVDIWPMTLALPAFFGGVIFSGVLAIAAGRRRFDEMSLPGFAGWGALGGLAVAAFIIAVAGPTLPSLVASTVVTLLCSGSAAGSLALARMSEEQELLDASEDVAEVGLTSAEVRELLGGKG